MEMVQRICMKRHFFVNFGAGAPKKGQVTSFHAKPVAIVKNKRIMGTGIEPQKTGK